MSRQKELLLKITGNYATTVTIHGEPEEKAFFVGHQEGIAVATEEFRKSGWFDPQHEDRMLDIYKYNLFLNDRVEDYDNMISQHDFAIGYRVHGVLPALANGIPASLVDYDTRSGELAETFSIPNASDVAILESPLDRVFDPSQFGDFIKNFAANYDRFKSYLDSSGIPNRM
ncbi:polysaccharide pyruvyl transferase family protein [Roseixanthobacter liquoris]|uniref:polysaccharide pyruvyl transferase family protein n=1 Tax=Roseixanthobacter liquoris TaxID=3119921 RepID=UPI00372CD915